MAQFKFKLQAVHRQRELLEQERQRDFAVVQARLVLEQQELKRLDETVRLAVTDLRENQLVGRLNLSYLAAHRRFMLAMQRQGLAQLVKVDAAKKLVDAARVKLLEAAKQKKIIEKLRERQETEWKQAAARKETADLDEIATQMSTVSMREQWSRGDQSMGAGSTEISDELES
jgi:flagellar FliJ protein